jgi:hypothetical protein
MKGIFNDLEAEQVELMRDRKILDLNSSLLKTRNDRMNSYIDRLSELSNSSQCLAQALPVQIAFHKYETEVYKSFEKMIKPLPTIYNELINK